MSDSNIKDIRKQLRNIVKENIEQELGQALYDKVMSEVSRKIKEIEADVKKTLHEINVRHKDTMQFLVRQVTVPTKDDENKDER